MDDHCWSTHVGLMLHFGLSWLTSKIFTFPCGTGQNCTCNWAQNGIYHRVTDVEVHPFYPCWIYPEQRSSIQRRSCVLVKLNLFSCRGSVHPRVIRQPLPAIDSRIMEMWNAVHEWTGGSNYLTYCDLQRQCFLLYSFLKKCETHTAVLLKMQTQIDSSSVCSRPKPCWSAFNEKATHSSANFLQADRGGQISWWCLMDSVFVLVLHQFQHWFKGN